MPKEHPNFTPNVHTALVSQVGGDCPLCGLALMYKKNKRLEKGYEIAHIYPLNPKPEEFELLRDFAVCASEINHTDNLIPLCPGCHGRFDKPRTKEEFIALRETKDRLIREEIERNNWTKYHIEDEIKEVIRSLNESEETTNDANIEYDLKKIDDKMLGKTDNISRKKVKRLVRDYFSFVKFQFNLLERSSPSSYELIATQVKSYYLDQKKRGTSGDEVLKNISLWIRSKTRSPSSEACDIVVSYFIQNCEVFS